jgi:hypothetical protein
MQSKNVTQPLAYAKSIGPFYYTGHTQKNGEVLIVFTIKTAPFFCVCPVFSEANFLTKNWYAFVTSSIMLIKIHTLHLKYFRW